MSVATSRAQRRQLERDNAKRSVALARVPRHEWPESMAARPELVEVWRSRDFLVQVFAEAAPVLVRLTVNSTHVAGARWADGISWDQLQRIKAECGYGLHDAVEVFPCDLDVVNVANMRHLWVMRVGLSFKWRRSANAD